MSHVNESDNTTQNVTLKSLIPYFILGATIYLVILFFGYLVGVAQPADAIQVAHKFQVVQGNILNSQPVYIETFLFFVNNAFLGFLTLYAGYMFAQGTGYWFGSVVTTLFSATQIGAIISSISNKVGMKFTLIAILPHGIFELSAIFACLGMGIMLGYKIMLKRCEEPEATCSNLVKRCQIIFAKYIIPLYLVAAIIEGYVTPAIIQLALHYR